VPVRGPLSGRLYGYIDPVTLAFAFYDRQRRCEEIVDLNAYRAAPAVRPEAGDEPPAA
jgi:hypothetical protein